MLLKCCNHYASKFGKLSSGHRTGKSQFLFQSLRRVKPKNVQITLQLHSFHMLGRWFSKSFKIGLKNLDLEIAEEPEIKLPKYIGSQKKQENSRKKHLFLLKPLTVWITKNCRKFLKRWEYQTTLPASWETCIQVKKQQLELDIEQWTGSKLGKV